jgi:hypothetical protein
MRSSFSRSPSSMRDDRNAGPLGDDLGDLGFGDLIAQQLIGLLLDLERLGEALLELRECVRTAARTCAPDPARAAPYRDPARALELLFDVRGALHRGLLGLPDLLEIGVFLLERLSASSSVLRRLREASSVSFLSASRSIFSWMMRRSSLSSASGLESISMRISEPASSIKSMALSGSCRSAM